MQMDNPANRLNEAITLFGSGRVEGAITRLEAIIEDEPANPLALHFLGLCHHRQGKREAALELLLKSVAIAPTVAALHSNLGLFFAETHQMDRAFESLRTALRLDPQCAQTHNNLGTILQKKGQLAEAMESFRRALGIKPDFCEALNNLGSTLATAGRTPEAIETFEKAIQLSPAIPEIYVNVGNLYLAERHIDTALERYQEALRLRPNYLEGINGLARALHAKGDAVAAIELLRRTLEQHPSSAKIYFELGGILKAEDRIEEALPAFEKAANLDPAHFYACWNACLSLPVIYRNFEEIGFNRRRWQTGIRKLIARLESQPLATSSLPFVAPHTNFYLHYQCANDSSEQKQFAGLISRLAGRAYPHLSQPRPATPSRCRKKIRVGFVSCFFSLHTVFKLFHGWIKHLNRERFETYCFHLGKEHDKASQHVQSISDSFFSQFTCPDSIVQKILESDLDLLIYPEIGMDPLTQSLAALRLAPIQCMAWGHPVTSGLETIDYFLSSELMEASWADSHYSETLVRLPNLSICYPLPEAGLAQASEILGSTDKAKTRFLSLQSLFKLLPQHDDLYPKIALEVPKSEFWFIALDSRSATDLFRKRLSESFQRNGLDPAQYLKIFPKMSIGSFFGLVKAADVILDSVGWSGGNTTLEAICLDKPIVTLPGEMMRSRHTYAILTFMGVVETIAKNLEEYVSIAVRLALDKAWRSDLICKTSQYKRRVYNDLESVRGLEKFIVAALAKTH